MGEQGWQAVPGADGVWTSRGGGARTDLLRTQDGGASWQRLAGMDGVAVMSATFQSATEGLLLTTGEKRCCSPGAAARRSRLTRGTTPSSASSPSTPMSTPDDDADEDDVEYIPAIEAGLMTVTDSLAHALATADDATLDEVGAVLYGEHAVRGLAAVARHAAQRGHRMYCVWHM
jgi:hypothetical protein